MNFDHEAHRLMRDAANYPKFNMSRIRPLKHAYRLAPLRRRQILQDLAAYLLVLFDAGLWAYVVFYPFLELFK